MKPPVWHQTNARSPAQVDAHSDTHVDVDFMIMDYLACLAINSILLASRRQTQGIDTQEDDLDWQVESLEGFRSLVASTHPEIPLPQDLHIKLQLLAVADGLRHYGAQSNQTQEECPRLPAIGVAFMDLCTTAAAKVSETRWFDTGARFMVQAVLEDQRDGRQPSEDMSKLCSWSPSDPALGSKWVNIRQRYASALTDAIEHHRGQSVTQNYPLSEFKAIAMTFLRDLMMTLDPPIIIQLERGQLSGLSPEETQRLKARVGLR
ncbi:hypothetical protein N7490_009363 [Penicillium lividum]|nr:hypothetical protein N7490_009363 [Penicillium lividum]